MELKTLISDMSQLEAELSGFEKQFGVKSGDFYQTITTGETVIRFFLTNLRA